MSKILITKVSIWNNEEEKNLKGVILNTFLKDGAFDICLFM